MFGQFVQPKPECSDKCQFWSKNVRCPTIISSTVNSARFYFCTSSNGVAMKFTALFMACTCTKMLGLQLLAMSCTGR